MVLATRIFSEAWDQPLYAPYGARHHLSAFGMARRICLADPPTGLNQDIQHPAGLPFSVSPSLITPHRWCRNINLLSITYAFRPRLRNRLTLGRLTLPRKPETCGEWVSHPFYRYSCLHNLFQYLQQSLRSAFAGDWNAPLPMKNLRRDSSVRSFGDVLSPVTSSARTHSTSELLRFL